MRFALTTLGWIGLAHVVILLKKERDICVVQEDKQREGCASYCNIPLYWQEEAPCDKCNNGGIYDINQKKCKCPPTHKGTYCCGKSYCYRTTETHRLS